MPNFLKLMTLASFVAFSSTAIAQDSQTPAADDETPAVTSDAASTPDVASDETPATEEAAAETATGETPEALNMGQDVADEKAPGTTYVLERFSDWELRCVRVEEGQKEPCQLFQLMKDTEGSPIAEMNLITLENGGQAVAGATIVAPLETLLTEQLTLAVDGGAKKRYPFRFCNPVGCYAQIGFSNGEVASFKRGASATLTIVPHFAPKEVISVKLSLSGFTKAYAALQEISK